MTGRLMQYMGYFTTAVSGFLAWNSVYAAKHMAISFALESIKCFGKSGIIVAPGAFMIYKGIEIEREGWAGQ